MSFTDDVVHNISIRCPGFAEYWTENRHRQSDESGHVTLHGTFSVLSEFMEDHFRSLSDEQHLEFWEWIEWQVTSSDEELSNAAVTCFIENVADTEVETYCTPFMPAVVAEWFDRVMHRVPRKKR